MQALFRGEPVGQESQLAVGLRTCLLPWKGSTIPFPGDVNIQFHTEAGKHWGIQDHNYGVNVPGLFEDGLGCGLIDDIFNMFSDMCKRHLHNPPKLENLYRIDVRFRRLVTDPLERALLGMP